MGAVRRYGAGLTAALIAGVLLVDGAVLASTKRIVVQHIAATAGAVAPRTEIQVHRIPGRIVPATLIPAAPPPAFSVTANGPRLDVSRTPGGAPVLQLPNPTVKGAALTLLLREQRGDWIRVLLAIRPNGTTGWVRAADVTVHPLPYAIVVIQHLHQAEIWRGTQLIRTIPTAVGKPATPTPDGLFFVDVVYDTGSEAGPYGRFVLGTNGFSNVLQTFGDGDAEIAMHGTDEQYSVGTSASHGCMRLHNADADWLAHLVPLGTPIYIST